MSQPDRIRRAWWRKLRQASDGEVAQPALTSKLVLAAGTVWLAIPCTSWSTAVATAAPSMQASAGDANATLWEGLTTLWNEFPPVLTGFVALVAAWVVLKLLLDRRVIVFFMILLLLPILLGAISCHCIRPSSCRRGRI